MVSGSWSNLSYVIKASDLDHAMHLLSQEFPKSFMKKISVMGDISLVTVVGAGIRSAKGIAARVFGAVADVGANLIMIAQGSSKTNIAFVVKSNEVIKVVAAIHDKFIK